MLDPPPALVEAEESQPAAVMITMHNTTAISKTAPLGMFRAPLEHFSDWYSQRCGGLSFAACAGDLLGRG
jgi:hypothetical protein